MNFSTWKSPFFAHFHKKIVLYWGILLLSTILDSYYTGDRTKWIRTKWGSPVYVFFNLERWHYNLFPDCSFFRYQLRLLFTFWKFLKISQLLFTFWKLLELFRTNLKFEKDGGKFELNLYFNLNETEFKFGLSLR